MKKIKIGIAGATGNQGRCFVRWFKKIPELAVVNALCDTRKPQLKTYAQELGVKAVYTDLMQMLNEADIDLVVVVTPDYLHCDMVLKTASAGKHIICEKPLALNIDDALKMKKAVEQASLGNVINFQHRFVPSVKELHNRFKKGELGQIKAFNARISVPLPDAMPFTWRQQKGESAGGALADCGSHLIDIANWFFDSLPERVIAFNGIAVPYRPVLDEKVDLVEAWNWGVEHKAGLPNNIRMGKVTTPDYSQLMMVFPGKKLAVLRVEQAEVLSRIGPYITIELHGTEATGLCCVDWTWKGLGNLKIYQSQGSEESPISFPEITLDDWTATVMKDALMKIDNPDNPDYNDIPDFTDGVNVQKVIQAAVESVDCLSWNILNTFAKEIET